MVKLVVLCRAAELNETSTMRELVCCAGAKDEAAKTERKHSTLRDLRKARCRTLDIAGCALLQTVLDHLAKCVQEDLMGFLNTRGMAARSEQLDIREASRLSATPAQEGNGSDVQRLCLLEGASHILALPARGEGD
jgi:hypothetical protein